MVDQFRRRAIEQAYLEELQHLPTRHMESSEERMMNLEALMRIDAMFAGLNPNIRTAFLLSRLHGMTYPDIAREMNVSLRSVEVYMAKAISHLLANARQDTLG
jgi:RNA polymerase sigma-70 factor (ECF subfamily)